MGADADIFMILLRPTRVPIVGESVSHLFQGQVLIESMKWNLHNEEERKNAEKASSDFSEARDLVDSHKSNQLRRKHLTDDYEKADEGVEKSYQRAVGSGKDPHEAHAAYVKQRDALWDGYKKSFNAVGAKREKDAEPASEEDKRSAAYAAADRNRNFEITFTKRVDLSSTQMLNSMKAGDVFPSGTLTIHKRSATTADGTSLVFTIQKIRLLDYRLQVSVSDTMTEMMEEWTCEFGALAYVYKNPPSHYSHGNAAQGAAKTASQGTMRAFTMKNIGSPI